MVWSERAYEGIALINWPPGCSQLMCKSAHLSRRCKYCRRAKFKKKWTKLNHNFSFVYLQWFYFRFSPKRDNAKGARRNLNFRVIFGQWIEIGQIINKKLLILNLKGQKLEPAMSEHAWKMEKVSLVMLNVINKVRMKSRKRSNIFVKFNKKPTF